MTIALIPQIENVVNYYASAEEGSDNGCAHAAVATMIHYWDRDELYPGRESDALVRAVYREHPPDTPFAWWAVLRGICRTFSGRCGFGAGDAPVPSMPRRI